MVSKIWGHLLLIYRLFWMTQRENARFAWSPVPSVCFFKTSMCFLGLTAISHREKYLNKIGSSKNWALVAPLCKGNPVASEFASQTGLGIFSFDFSNKTSKWSLRKEWLHMNEANRKIPGPLWVSHRPAEIILETNALKNEIWVYKHSGFK